MLSLLNGFSFACLCLFVCTGWSSGKKSTSKADPRGRTFYYDDESYNSRQSELRAVAPPSSFGSLSKAVPS